MQWRLHCEIIKNELPSVEYMLWNHDTASYVVHFVYDVCFMKISTECANPNLGPGKHIVRLATLLMPGHKDHHSCAIQKRTQNGITNCLPWVFSSFKCTLSDLYMLHCTTQYTHMMILKNARKVGIDWISTIVCIERPFKTETKLIIVFAMWSNVLKKWDKAIGLQIC